MIEYYNSNKNKDKVPDRFTKIKNGFHLVNDVDYNYFWIDLEDFKVKSDDDLVEIYGYLNNRFLKVIGTRKKGIINNFKTGRWKLIDN